MDPESVTALIQTTAGAAGAIKTVLGVIAAARAQVKDNKEADNKLSEASELVLELRSRLFDLQEKALHLQQEYAGLLRENMELREDIRREQARTTERQKYKRKQVGGSVLIMHNDDPSTLFCPACFETKDRTIPLQDHSREGAIHGSYYCPACQERYRI